MDLPAGTRPVVALVDLNTFSKAWLRARSTGRPEEPSSGPQLTRANSSDFTRVDSLTLEADESSAFAMTVDPNRERLVVALASFPAKVAIIDLATFEREGAATLRGNESAVTSALGLDAFGEYGYLGLATSPGRVARVELSPRPLRLGLYGNSGDQKTLLWESPPVPLSASETWIDVGIVEGNPTTLTLPPDEYWLAWQVDASTTAASYSVGGATEGLCLYWPHGSFPESLIPGTDTGWSTTSDRWSGYLNYDEAPTATPTETASSTPTPSNTGTPTATSTPLPTPSGSRTPTPSWAGSAYDVQPDPRDGKIDARDLLDWFKRLQDDPSVRDSVVDFSRYWQAEERFNSNSIPRLDPTPPPVDTYRRSPIE